MNLIKILQKEDFFLKGYYIITFKNTYNAMEGEKVLKKENINNQVMPTPTVITRSCGISLKIEEDEYPKIEQIIGKREIKPKSILYRSENSYKIVKEFEA